MSFSDYLYRLEDLDGDIKAFQHNHTGAFYAVADGTSEAWIYDAGEDSISTVDITTVDQSVLVRIPELKPSANK